MPYADKKKTVARLRTTYYSLQLSIRRDSGILEALERMQENTGIPLATYAQTALLEKLEKDGFIEYETVTVKRIKK